MCLVVDNAKKTAQASGKMAKGNAETTDEDHKTIPGANSSKKESGNLSTKGPSPDSHRDSEEVKKNESC